MTAARRAACAVIAAWELPQNVLGLALLGLLRLRCAVVATERNRGRLFIENRAVAVSLGWFVFWTRHAGGPEHDLATREHEYGHTVQSRMLGPLYLPLVGAPSVSRVLYAIGYRRVTGRLWDGYFDGWPEAQADRLGGVVRRRRQQR